MDATERTAYDNMRDDLLVKLGDDTIDAANAAIRQANSIAEAYGLTPMSRKKLTKGEVKDGDDTSPLTEFFRDNG
jgi:phage terminase small subunit